MMIVKPWMITFYRLEEGNSINPKVANKDDATTLLGHKATQNRAQIDKVLLSSLTTITKEKNECIPPSSKN
jgi:predicted MarR family transcription regulator